MRMWTNACISTTSRQITSFGLSTSLSPIRKPTFRIDFVDTEAATNVVFDAGDAYARRLDLALELNAAASNSVVVA